jgi:signal transduction histidine kinase
MVPVVHRLPGRALPLKLLGLLVAASAVAVVVALAVVTLQSQSRAQHEAIARFDERAGIVAQLLSGSVKQTLATAASDNAPHIAEHVTEANLQRLEGNGDALIPYTAVLDDHGTVLAAHPANAPVGPRSNEESRDLVAKALASDATQMTTVMRTAAGQVIEFEVPYHSRAGAHRVLVVGYTKQLFGSGFEGPIDAATGPYEGSAFVLDRKGVIVTESGAGPTAHQRRLVQDATRSGREEFVDGDVRYSIVPVDGSPLVVALAVPDAEILAQLPSTLWPRVALAGLVLSLLAIALLVRGMERARRRTEQARLEADDANRAKSEFLSHVSHELKTPIAVIRGFADLLRRSSLDERDLQFVQHIDDGSEHLFRLAEDLLEVSRIEAGHVTLALEPLDLRMVVEEVLVLSAPLAAENQIRLEPPTLRDAIPLVLADQLRLRQVLLNLLSNAIKYNHERGVVHLSIDAAGTEVRVSVADTGTGIAAEDIPRLFHPFERLAAEGGPVRGTGLGLCVTKGLVEAMGGTLDVQSEQGVGSTFSFELPAMDRAIPTDGLPPASVDPATVGRIVYIDNHVATLELVERLVQQMRPGLSVHTAVDGTSGIELVQRESTDLLLLDLNLPDMHGELVLRSLRSEPATANLPVLIVSADSTARDVTRLLRAGADAYLTKPLVTEQFLDVVDRLLAGRRTPA